ncbi:hypothetical protein AVEN_193814-1 [Araneus ventricosus]|uniref:Uncharacterized protein n=1 Tax=Araneus ventricosus TaxID=182803 RepID=A0A4Y2HIX2_ARAVE|nr:hypothetical protein AVEN_193814-1 [Araneus ventricosus]
MEGKGFGEKLVVEVLKCGGLTDNLTPEGACEPANYRDGTRTAWLPKSWSLTSHRIIQTFKDFIVFFFSNCTAKLQEFLMYNHLQSKKIRHLFPATEVLNACNRVVKSK